MVIPQKVEDDSFVNPGNFSIIMTPINELCNFYDDGLSANTRTSE